MDSQSKSGDSSCGGRVERTAWIQRCDVDARFWITASLSRIPRTSIHRDGPRPWRQTATTPRPWMRGVVTWPEHRIAISSADVRMQ